jgi:hypothetical protein
MLMIKRLASDQERDQNAPSRDAYDDLEGSRNANP